MAEIIQSVFFDPSSPKKMDYSEPVHEGRSMGCALREAYEMEYPEERYYWKKRGEFVEEGYAVFPQ